MKNKLKAGLVFTEKTSLAPYFHALSSYATVSLISPNTERRGDLDLLVIPDKVSAYRGLACFASQLHTTVCLAPVCPYFETFCLDGDRGIDFYIRKQIRIIGIGDGSIYLWNHLGGKSSISESGDVRLLSCDNAEPIKRTKSWVSEFRGGNFVGVETLQSATFKQELISLQKALLVYNRDLETTSFVPGKLTL